MKTYFCPNCRQELRPKYDAATSELPCGWFCDGCGFETDNPELGALQLDEADKVGSITGRSLVRSLADRVEVLEGAFAGIFAARRPQADEDDVGQTIVFGGDPAPVQRLVLTSENVDVSGGFLLAFRHEYRDDDGEWVIHTRLALGTEPIA